MTALLMGLAVTLISCGASTPPSSEGTSSTTTLVITTTSSTSPTTTSIPPTTTTTTSPTTTTTQPPEPSLPADAPATFVAVTEDYEAVEVDAATGSILGSFGQMADAAELAAAPEDLQAFTIHIREVWRTRDGSWHIVGECCEPAGGSLHRLRLGEVLNRETHDDRPSQLGWYVTPVSGDDVIITSEARITIGPVGGQPWFDVEVHPLLALGAAQWDEAAEVVRFIAQSFESDMRRHLLVETNQGGIVSTIPLGWVGDDQHLSGLARHRSGQLLTVRYDLDSRGFWLSNTATLVVFQPDGSVVGEYGFAPGGSLGGYDPSGRYLIYVDGHGTVRWRGDGKTGALADGFIFASW